MRTLLSALAIAAASLTALPAAAEGLTNEKSQIEGLTAANVSEILTELGAQNVKTHDKNGRTIITFDDRGIPYNMGIVCDKLGCTSLLMLVGLNTGTKKYPLDVLNSANMENMIVAVTRSDQDTILISRVTFTDGGVSKKNIAVNVGSFVRAVGDSIKFLNTQIVAGYQQGSPSQFQPVVMGTNSLRPEAIQPGDVVKAMDKQAPHKGTSLKN